MTAYRGNAMMASCYAYGMVGRKTMRGDFFWQQVVWLIPFPAEAEDANG